MYTNAAKTDITQLRFAKYISTFILKLLLLILPVLAIVLLSIILFISEIETRIGL